MTVQQTHALRECVCLLDGTEKILQNAGLIFVFKELIRGMFQWNNSLQIS